MSDNCYDFDERLRFSHQGPNDIATIKRLLTGAVSVEKASTELDRQGIDYVATLRRGRAVPIDVKRRAGGCSRWWKGGTPEVALEYWSVMPGGHYKMPESKAKAGWTLSESTKAELILFVYDPADHPTAYLVPFQHLRMAFRANSSGWRERFRVETQRSNGWESECVFVPMDVMWDAVRRSGRGSPEHTAEVSPLFSNAHQRTSMLEQMRRWRNAEGHAFVSDDDGDGDGDDDV